jgi:hypothetical protein
MKSRVRVAFCMAVAVALAGCSTTGSRIREQQAVFDSYPEHVQLNLRAGNIEVGYTPEMVFIALGEPDRKAEVVTGEGASEVWTWWTRSPGIGFGLGSSRALGSSVGLGTGIAVGNRARREEQAVVEFVSGRVRRFEMLAPR